jgi:hypothetical protein
LSTIKKLLIHDGFYLIVLGNFLKIYTIYDHCHFCITIYIVRIII